MEVTPRIPGSAWIGAGCILVVHGLDTGWAPTSAVAVIVTALLVAIVICGAMSLAMALRAIEARTGKPIPVRLLTMFSAKLLARACAGAGGIAVEPGLIAVPAGAWLHVASDLLLAVPVLMSVSDVLGRAALGRGTVAARIAAIATVCGLSGLAAGWFLLSNLYTIDAAEFDRMVAGPALGAIVLAATAGTAMCAARKALADAQAREESDASYRILRPLGAGGMGEVFLAERIGPHGFQRAVVLKRILAAEENDPVSIERFLEEARIAARLQHPNIVAVNDLGRLEQGWFLAMEYLAGLTVRELITLLDRFIVAAPAEAIASIGTQVCRGLAHAHAHGVIHRDISPHNLMVTFEGVVKILDFGVAKVKAQPFGATRESRTGAIRALTSDGVLVGKVAYLAPEQFRGLPASPAGDVFALGVALYELASGEHPYGRVSGTFPVGESEKDFVPLWERRADLPLALCTAIDRALGFDPWNRHRSAAELSEALLRGRSEAARFDLGAWLRGFAPPDAETLTPPNGTATMPFAARHAPEPAR